MANTMFNGMNVNSSLRNQFNNFKKNLEQSGKDPRKLLEELVSSGKVSKEQLEKAKVMASMYAKLW